MSEKTEIAWCDSTFSPWIGCQKVSAGCDHCYAETLMDTRYGRVKWGPHGERVRTSEANWKLPARWARKARAAGTRPKVFCSSLADVFDNKADKAWRWELWELIQQTPELDWLLLTKRPENIDGMLGPWDRHGFPSNVWLGTTCEDQAAYDRRWPVLARFNVRVRFISYEPAIGSLTILNHKEKPDWLICGGESGKGYRDVPLMTWAGDLIDECAEHFIPFFMKQMPGLRPIPDEIMVRQFPAGARCTA